MSDKIPSLTWRKIFLLLPAESLFRLRGVCKRWCTSIDDPCFVKAHTSNQLLSSNTILVRHSTGPPFYPFYSVDLETLNFANGPQTITVTSIKLSPSGLSRLRSFPVAACNGLMLIDPVEPREEWNRTSKWVRAGSLEIWNPLTHERLKVPQPNIDSKLVVVGYGLGYDRAAHDYKIVMIDYPYRPDKKSVRRTHVYSLKSDSWKMIEKFPFRFLAGFGYIEQGVYLNGALHWLSEHGIVALDLATEKYHQLKLPLPRDERVYQRMRLDALSGYLFLTQYSRELVDMWVMNDYGAEDSWVKLFSIVGYNGLRPLAYLENKKQVLLQDRDEIVWVDIGSDSKKKIRIHGILNNFSAQICGGSLFRLRDSCGRVSSKGGTRKRKSMADTTLTFCVRDYGVSDRSSGYPLSHDKCYRLDSNWFDSSIEGNEV